MTTKSILLPALMLALASCSSVQVPNQPSAQTPEVLQKEPGIEVLLLDPSSRTARPDFTGKMKLVSETISYPEHLKDMPALTEAPGPVRFNPALLQENQVQTQAGDLKVIKTEWKPDHSFVQRKVSPIFQRKIGPHQITLTVAGEYNLQITLDGDIRMIKASGGGSIKVQAGMTYSKTYYTCAKYQTVTLERYTKFYQWATYSNGTVKKTGGESDSRQPAKPGDVTDNKLTDWYTC